MLDLQNVTLCAIETRSLGPVIAAIQHSASYVDFAEVLLISAEPANLNVKNFRNVILVPFNDVGEYSDFILRDLHNYIKTDFVLLMQWDGYIVDPTQWVDEFLCYDYIGAPWPHHNEKHKVGNGGFSLRSKRLLEAVKNPEIIKHHPEDVAICQTNRALLEQKYGISFAPIELARRFSFERERSDHSTFGFHGLFNIGDVLDTELIPAVRQLPSDMLRGRDARELCLNLLRSSDSRKRHAGRILMFRMLVDDPRNKANWYVYQQWLIALKERAARAIVNVLRTRGK